MITTGVDRGRPEGDESAIVFTRVNDDGTYTILASLRGEAAEYVAQLEAEKYCYEDELPCELTSELFASSIVDGVRLYPWKAVAEALKAENERLAGLQNRIFTWARQTFGAEQRQDGIFAHLTREIKELGKSIPESDPDELADCTILLFELAGYAEVDLLDEVEKKFTINQQRKWGPMQEDGSILHIEHLDVEALGGE